MDDQTAQSLPTVCLSVCLFVCLPAYLSLPLTFSPLIILLFPFPPLPFPSLLFLSSRFSSPAPHSYLMFTVIQSLSKKFIIFLLGDRLAHSIACKGI